MTAPPSPNFWLVVVYVRGKWDHGWYWSQMKKFRYPIQNHPNNCEYKTRWSWIKKILQATFWQRLWDCITSQREQHTLLQTTRQIMASIHQRREIKLKLTIWRQCVFCSVRTRRGIVYYSRTWGTGRMWARMDITSQSHLTWICWSVNTVGFMGIKNPLMRTVVIEEAITQKDEWDKFFISNSREAPDKIQHQSLVGMALH